MDAFEVMVQDLRGYFMTNVTKPAEWRKSQLMALKQMLTKHEMEWAEAMAADLKRPLLEARAEVVIALKDLNDSMQFQQWMRPEKLPSPALVWPCNTELRHEPIGVVLVIGAFNVPLQSTFKTLVSSMAAGNCCVVKPSEQCPKSEQLMVKLLPKYLDTKAFRVVTGGPVETERLLKVQWDFIVFTGSQRVAKIVQKAAAEFLTPTILELGGKNPVIVDNNPGSLALLAKRLISTKLANAAQTCLAPDYVVCLEESAPAFEAACVKALHDMYGQDPKQSDSLGRIVSEQAAERMQGWIKATKGTIVCGGEVDVKRKYVAPTIIRGEALTAPLMENEIFGPILLFHTVKTLDEAIALVEKVSGRSPLALYVFSQRSHFQEECLRRLPSGGAMVNDAVYHMLAGPFGGVNSSGNGKLTAIWGFRSLSNQRTVVFKRLNFFDAPIRFPPFTELAAKIFATVGPAAPDVPPLPLATVAALALLGAAYYAGTRRS